MTMDISLRVRTGMTRARSVLTRDERIKRLKDAERWKEGDSPYGLPKVRVYKLAVKKKKKKAKEEGEEGADAAAVHALALGGIELPVGSLLGHRHKSTPCRTAKA